MFKFYTETWADGSIFFGIKTLKISNFECTYLNN